MDYHFDGTVTARGYMGALDPTTIGECSRRRVRLICFLCKHANECNHTSTNAPDPIRTPQLSMLGQE
jgi:hypothetical protein